MLKYRQILPLLLLGLLTGCTAGSWKPKWISRFRPGAEERRTANTDADTDADNEAADRQKQQIADADADADADAEPENADAELAAVERHSRLIRDAQTALRADNLEEARRLYRDVLNEAPDHPDAHHGLAMAADLDEDWGDAEYHYKQALRIRPKDAVLLSDIGYSYVLQNRYAEATRYLNQAIELQPGYERAHMNLALLDLRQGNRAAAEQRLVQRLGNSAKTASILDSLERQAFPVTAVAAVPRPDSRQPAADMSLADVQEIARREREIAEQRRNAAESAPRTPQPWFPANTPNSRTPVSTVSGHPAPAYQPPAPPPAFASQPEYRDRAQIPNSSAQIPAPQDHPSAGYSSRDYAGRDYPYRGYPSADYPSPDDAGNPYADAGYPGPTSPPVEFQQPQYPESGYSPEDRDPLRSAPPSYATADQQMPGRLSADRSESLDRPSGRLTLPGPSNFPPSMTEEQRPQAAATPQFASESGAWSSNSSPGATGISVRPPVPIRSSSAGTTAGAESYGQPAGFNRSLPGRMRVVESGGGQSGFPVYGADSGFRTEGLNVGPGALFPPVEPRQNPVTPQRTIAPAGYSDTNERNGVLPAWGGGAQRPQNREPAGEPAGGRGTAMSSGYPGMWPPATGGPGGLGADAAVSGESDATTARGPVEGDRALQSYRDQLQQINSQFNRQPPPASYNDRQR